MTATQTAPAPTRRQPPAPATVGNKGTLQSLLENKHVQQSIADIIPKHLTPNRLVKMMLVAVSRTPKLLECTQESVLQAAMRSAELGLDCGGTLGQAYLVPFYNGKTQAMECQFIPGYRGLIDLARRGGQIASIRAHCVYTNDTFTVEYGTAECIVHKPKLDGGRGELLCVYAIAELKDGSTQSETMTRDQVDDIRGRSKAGDSGPWKTDYDEMARKTVVRRLCKYLPLSAELERAMEIDNDTFEPKINIVDPAIATGQRVLSDLEKLPSVEPVDDTRPTQEEAPQPPPPPAAGPLDLCDQLTEKLATKLDVRPDAAKRVLEQYSTSQLTKPFADIDGADFDLIEEQIDKGNITIPKTRGS